MAFWPAWLLSDALGIPGFTAARSEVTTCVYGPAACLQAFHYPLNAAVERRVFELTAVT